MNIDSAYLDYYNLNVYDEKAKEQFINKYNIKKQIISGGIILSVEDLIEGQYRGVFRQTFDFLTKHNASDIINTVNKEIQQADPSLKYAPDGFPSYMLVAEAAHKHLNRTKPAWVDIQYETGYLWRGFWCEDFLALVYLQLWVSLNDDSEHKVCPHCGEIFTTTNPRKKYCNRNCQKTAADRRRTSSPEYREYIRNYMHEYRKS